MKNFVLLEKETGITRKTLAKLYNDEGKGIDYATLDALCTFFGCQPGDILEHVPDED
nr:helix-turn-helix transcriptional regulator [Paenibacillus sp. S25]